MLLTDISETVRGLRQLADYLETNADTINTTPDVTGVYGTLLAFAGPELAAALPGRWEKNYDDYSLRLAQQFPGRVQLCVYMSRTEVCEKIPTGRTVTRRVATAWEEVEEDEYEWDCRPVLQAAAGTSA